MLDLLPHETRGLYGYDRATAVERFTADTWVQRDICDREPWPFADGQFDFAVCSHTLEDVRDPVFVCKELQRTARAGYIEVPSRIEEHMTGLSGDWPGWAHHRWICEVDPFAPAITFVHKSHGLPAIPYRQLPIERRVQWLRWEGAFAYEERIFMDVAELHAWFDEVLNAVV